SFPYRDFNAAAIAVPVSIGSASASSSSSATSGCASRSCAMRHCGPLWFARAIARASSIRDMRAPISGSGPRFLSGLGSSLREERLQVRLDLFHSVLQRRDPVVKGLPAVRFELLGDLGKHLPGVLHLVERFPYL